MNDDREEGNENEDEDEDEDEDDDDDESLRTNDSQAKLCHTI